MKNEVMAKAITGIDDNLISDAENIKKKKSIIRPVFSLCAVAACLVLVFSFIFTLASQPKTQLLLNGNEVTDIPIALETPYSLKSRAVSNEFTVLLTLEVYESTDITISKGKMNVCSAGETKTLYYTGTSYTTEVPVNIHWLVDGLDINSAYTLTVTGDEETVYALTFDETHAMWSICKQ